MHLTTKARYAVMAMTDLAFLKEQETSSLSAIAERQGLPLPYLEQLFLKLRKAGLVHSVRGATGGYHLTRPAQEVLIYDIIAAVDKPLQATRCKQESSQGCMNFGRRCATHHLWEELGNTVQMFFKRVSLADVRNNTIFGKGTTT